MASAILFCKTDRPFKSKHQRSALDRQELEGDTRPREVPKEIDIRNSWIIFDQQPRQSMTRADLAIYNPKSQKFYLWRTSDQQQETSK